MTAETDPPEPDRLEGVPHPRETVNLYGQEAAEAAFLEACTQGRLAHGWLISGPRGIGKATLAWRIARYLAAGRPAATLQMDPGEPVFRQARALAMPQVLLCRRPWDPKAKRLRSAITVDEVRSLTRFFQLSAADGGWRVAIVDAADDLNSHAANALLKLLEEPPARAVLLLVCHQPARLLPTLRSRCQVLRCRPLAAEALLQALGETGFPVDARQAAALQVLADGSVGAAVRLASDGGMALFDRTLELIRAAPPLDRGRVIGLAEACGGRGAEARYERTLELIGLALSRLALAGAGAPIRPSSPAEAEAFSLLGQSAHQARLWAECIGSIGQRAAHARAVNLDPAQVILDIFLQIDVVVAQARALAV